MIGVDVLGPDPPEVTGAGRRGGGYTSHTQHTP
jgi:hypothetical protein